MPSPPRVSYLQVLPLLFAPLEGWGTLRHTPLCPEHHTPHTFQAQVLQLCPRVKPAVPAALRAHQPAAPGMQHRETLCGSGSMKL